MKNRRFTKTEKDIYELGYLNGRAEMKERMKKRLNRQTAYLIHWLKIYKTACNTMAKEIKILDHYDKGIRIPFCLADKFVEYFKAHNEIIYARRLQSHIRKTYQLKPELLDTLNQMRKKR
jgi:hypothetical protein